MNATQAKDLATRWLNAANNHDVNAIMTFYSEDAILESPVVTKLMNEPSGRIKGHEQIRKYFTEAMKAFPYMSLQMIDVAWGVASFSAWYVNQRGSRTSAYCEVDRNGKITKNVTHYNE